MLLLILQTHVLDEGAKHHPNSWWWVKADGCDLISGLAESTRGVWSGDVDLNDGALNKQYQEYNNRLLTIKNLKSSNANLLSQLDDQVQQLKMNIEFLHESKEILATQFMCKILFYIIGLQQVQATYEEKLKASTRVAEKTKFRLAWKIQELQDLHDFIRKLVVEISTLLDKLQSQDYNPVQDNFARKLSSVQMQLINAVKQLSKHQRIAATHVLVFMVSPESRSRQPYALPVQCLPICGIKDKTIRDMANKIIGAMVDRDMKVAGKVHVCLLCLSLKVVGMIRIYYQWRVQ